MSLWTIAIFAVLGLLLLFWLWIERGHILLPSVPSALKWLGFKRTLLHGLHGLLYGRFIPQYVKSVSRLAPHLGPRGRKWLENGYHGKVLIPELARAIITIDKDIPLTDLGYQVIPYPRARDIMLNAFPDIVVTQCGCKEIRTEACRLTAPPYQTCLAVGKPITDVLLEHRPKQSRRLTRNEALEKLKDFHKQGLVHVGWFKDAINDRFYVICNCCSCCCLGFETMKLGISQLVSSGYISRIDKKKCKGCGTCIDVCPFRANTLYTEGKMTQSQVNWDKCMGCGVCIDRCPHGARSIALDEMKGRPMDVQNLVSM